MALEYQGDFIDIRDREVRNRVRFGKDLNRWLFAVRQLALLRRFGWNDGGCRILTGALRRWIGRGEVVAIARIPVGRAPSIEHLMLKVDGVMLDGDGVSSSSDALARLRILEDLTGDLQFVKDPPAPLLAAVPFDQEIEDELVRRLHNRFGDFDEEWVAEPDERPAPDSNDGFYDEDYPL